MSRDDSDIQTKAEGNPSKGFGKRGLSIWFSILIILTFVLIVWGAMVRLTGSGLSIPEWPVINGSLLPPSADADWQEVFKTYYLEIHNTTDPIGPDAMSMSRFKTMFSIEYIHRAIAAIVGIIFIILLVISMIQKNRRKLIGDLMMIALFMLMVQVLLGGIVVKEELKAALVAAHLAAAYLFFALILWSYLKLRFSAGINALPQPSMNKLWLFSTIAAVVLFLQIVSGGLMAGSGAGHILNTYPKMGDVWVPSARVMFSDIYDSFWQNLTENRVLIQFLHRWWIMMVILTIGLMHAFSSKTRLSSRGRLALLGTGIILVFQLLLGIGNLMMKVPVYMSVSHSAVALLLFVCLIRVIFEARFEPEIQST
jgi:heme a synthase